MLDRQLTTQGFFHKHHQQVRNSVDDVTLKNFTNLECDVDRVSFIANIPQVRDFDPSLNVKINDPTFSIGAKDVDKARAFKDQGNAVVQKGDWGRALGLYTKSYLHMPSENVAEIAVIIANRSAALYHLKYYELAILDVDMALALNYPKDLRFKVYDRKARCYLALKWNTEAILAFRETVSALDIAKLPKERRTKMQTDAQIMMEILEKSIQMLSSKNKKANVDLPIKKIEKKEIPLPPVIGKKHSIYETATNALNIESNETEGRYAVATTDISVGDVIDVEPAHCSVLLAEFSKTHCQHCFEKCIAPVACPTCSNIIFCSEKCMTIASNSYHKYECPILKILWRSGCSITCHMALRIIVQRTFSYFIAAQSTLKKPKEGKYFTDDYARVYHLECNANMRSKGDYFQRTHMAVFLLNLLKKTNYLTSNESMSISEVETYAGELILRNLQLLQFNAHEIFELQCEKPISDGAVLRKDQGKSAFIGGGLYSMLALFNHSCDPSVVRYFQGTTVIVRAIKNIKKGEQISENYGPIFTRKPHTERKADLTDQYWFECHCIACEQNWPTFDEMNETIMRFKCDAGTGCTNVIPVPIDCQEFMIQCGLCQKYTNILKGLKLLQDTELVHKIGTDFLEKANYAKALEKFIEELKMYDDTLAPPFKDYNICQQNIRRCLLTLGNLCVE